MSTGENEQALRKILDMTRLIAIVILVIHCYYYCYRAFLFWQWTTAFTDRILGNICQTGLFDHFHTSKLMALAFLVISLIGVTGKKEEKLRYQTALTYGLIGLVLYFISAAFLGTKLDIQLATLLYIGSTSLGFVFILTGGTLLSRIIQRRLGGDIFNSENETFPQEERLLENEYSINLPAK